MKRVLSSIIAVLKVDGFLNHQIDPQLFKAIGKEIADRYRDAGVQRIVTIEASGIALALMAALELDVPLVFARKKKSILMVDDVYHSVVYSYTKEENYDITISKKFLPAGEKYWLLMTSWHLVKQLWALLNWFKMLAIQ